MKIGLQTIAWRDCDDRLDEPIKAAKQNGYDGIEIAQVVSAGDIFRHVVKILHENDLQLAGLSGGSLRDRLELAKQFESEICGVELPYIYADAWSKMDDQLFLDAQVRAQIAIHPHMFKPIQTLIEAQKTKKRFPYVKYMPDTAHSTIAGEDVLQFIGDNISECISIHIKDWSPEFGRSLPFYSTGFVSLGSGRVPVKEVIYLLKKKRYDGWLIVEQDFANAPGSEAERSREFLAQLGV